MGRRVRRWAAVVSLVCGGGVLAQPWPAVTAAQPDAEPVYLIRTAGQNDRSVKVVRAADPTDPASLAEVKDTATGATFHIPGKVLARLPKGGATRQEPAAPLSAEVTPPVAPTPTPPPPARIDPPTPKPTLVEPPTPVVIASPPGERMLTTWRADDPPAAPTPAKSQARSPARTAVEEQPLPVLPASAVVPKKAGPPTDPWRCPGDPKPLIPTPRPVIEPRLTPVPTWQATPLPTPPGMNDPWRPSGDKAPLSP